MKTMNYYERKDKARDLVVEALKANESVYTYELLNVVMMRTGLGNLFLTKMLQNLEQNKMISIDGDLVTLTKKGLKA